MALVIGAVTNLGLELLAKGWGPDGLDGIAYFRVGEGGYIVQAGGSEPRNPDASLENLDILENPGRYDVVTLVDTAGSLTLDGGETLVSVTTPFFGIIHEEGAIQVEGSGSGNDGVFMVTSVVSPTQVKIGTPVGTLPDTRNGSITIKYISVYSKSLSAGNFSYSATPTPTLLVTCTLTALEYNDDGTGANPEIWEIGLFNSSDEMVVYGTFDKQVKNGAYSITNVVKISLAGS